MPIYFHPSYKRFLVATGIAAFLAASVTGEAAEWILEPAVKLRREYNDNIRLTTQAHNSVQGSIITPSLGVGVNTPVWQTNAVAEATQRRYSGEEGLDQDDNLLRLSSRRRTERNTLRLDASRIRDSVLTGEYVGSDIGFVQTNKKREFKNIQPSWIWQYSERTELQLSYQLSDVSYQDAVSIGLYDYRYRASTAMIAHRISEVNQLFISGSYSNFKVEVTGFDSDTSNLQAGITRFFSSSTRGTLQAGLRRTESFTRGGNPIYTRLLTSTGDFLVQTGITQDVTRQKTGSVFSGNIETKYENMRIYATLGRTLDPSGSGGQIEQDVFRLEFNRQISPRLATYINANASKVRTVEGNISNGERTYFGLEPGARWQWLSEWSLGVNYRFSYVKRQYEAESADSNSVIFTLTYQPLKMSISR